MSDYINTVDIEGTQYDIQDTPTKEQAEENSEVIELLTQKVASIGQVVNLFTGPTGTTSLPLGNTILGSFILPKGKWILVSVFYSDVTWFGVGTAQDSARNYLEVKNPSGGVGLQYFRSVDIVEVGSNTTLYAKVWRDVAGTIQIYNDNIKGIKISD